MTFHLRAGLRAVVVMMFACAVSSVAIAAPYQCPFCDLSGKDLSGQDLTDASLQGADLSNANLSGANLSGAELSRANLAQANLSNAVLNPSANGETDLSSADLTGTNLSAAQMQNADLEYATLRGTNFDRADLTGARFGPAPEIGSYPGRKTSFRNAHLPAGLRLDAATSDSTGARSANAVSPAQKDNAFDVNCGSTDLSQLSKAVYVTNTGTDSSTCGATLSGACASIIQGLSQCGGAASCGVLVGFGRYPQSTSLALRGGDHLYGGCVAKGHGSSTGLKSLIQAPAGGVPAVVVSGGNAVTEMQNFKIAASAASASSSGAASIAMMVNNGNVNVLDSEVYAGPGTAGAVGCMTCITHPVVTVDGHCIIGQPSLDNKGTFAGTVWSGSRGGDAPQVDTGYGNILGGGGGQQGGGSFAVVVINSTMQYHSSSSTSRSRILGARGGDGGLGGNHESIFAGGAGGNGGPAVGIAVVGASVSNATDLTFYPGTGGGLPRKAVGPPNYCKYDNVGFAGLVGNQQPF